MTSLGASRPPRWPAVRSEQHPWHRESSAGESRRAALKARGPYQASIPPFIAALPCPALSSDATIAAEEATIEVTRFDQQFGGVVAPFAAILLRSESASSSEIEHLTARPKAIALAELGAKSGPNARLIVANTKAMEAAIELSDELSVESIIRMQATLLSDTEPHLTGKWREQQVWIGGGIGTHSPHTAQFVPPHPDRVPGLMNDLVAFTHRTDLPALVQVAMAHAQFETIHPFPDGNGRTGRAIVHSLLHRLGITRTVTVPVSAGLLQNTTGYFDALTMYRNGEVEPIIDAFAIGFLSAVANGRILVSDLERMRLGAESTTSARRGSAGWRTIELLQRMPVVNAATVANLLGVTSQNAQSGIDRLVADGILQQSGEGRRNRYFESREVLDALDGFAQRARRHR